MVLWSYGIYEAIADRVGDQFRRVVELEGLHHVCAMHSDCVGAQIKMVGNFLVRFAVCDELQNLKLSGSEAAGSFTFERRGEHQLGIDHDAAGGNILYRRHQVQINGVLQDVASRSRLKRSLHPRILRMHTQHQHGGLERNFPNLGNRVQSTHSWQRAIHNCYCRVQAAGQINRLFSVLGFSYDSYLRVIFQKAPESTAHKSVVLYKQNREFAERGAHCGETTVLAFCCFLYKESHEITAKVGNVSREGVHRYRCADRFCSRRLVISREGACDTCNLRSETPPLSTPRWSSARSL